MENLIYLLPVLACPVGMGLMMWLMMRGRQGQQTIQAPPTIATPPMAAHADQRLAHLRTRLGEVEAQQAAIAGEIERLAAENHRAAEPRAQR